MPKYTIYMMVGIPASGKSTLAKELASIRHSGYISRDEIRYIMTNSRKVNMENEGYVLNEFCRVIIDYFRFYNEVFADATHASTRSRFAFLHGIAKAAAAKDINFKDISFIPIVMETPYETCIERNSQRPEEFRTPEKDIINYYSKCVYPSKTELGIETYCPTRYFYNPKEDTLTCVTFEDKNI